MRTEDGGYDESRLVARGRRHVTNLFGPRREASVFAYHMALARSLDGIVIFEEYGRAKSQLNCKPTSPERYLSGCAHNSPQRISKS